MYTSVELPIVLRGEHWTVTAVSLRAFTDDLDTPVQKNEFYLFKGMLAEDVVGNIFFLENEHDGNAYVILTDCPDYQRAKLTVMNFTVSVDAGTNAVTAVSCKKGECEAACRGKYREATERKALVTMSNTWGDCNRFTRVCEEFVIKEIDKAAELGVEIVQIDDGWQFGNTADVLRRDERGRRVFADDFWQINTERFPHGLRCIADYAASKGVKVGLWFAPESRDHFVCMDRDIAILKNAYENWGIRFFKLDMYWIECDLDRDRFLQYLAAVYAFGDDVAVQLDVTRPDRINYLSGRRYGTLFVENRYTKKRTYFPHRTLKNFWLLSKYVPASRFQFEVINPALNKEVYAPDDEFAPARCGIDYLFASVMLSNPLFWMEMQFLTDEDSAKLKAMISVFKQYGRVFSEGDVAPIGQTPSGRSFTGFYIRHGGEEYALVFREATEKDTGRYFVTTDQTNAEVICANADVTACVEEDMLKVRFSKAKAFALLRLYGN